MRNRRALLSAFAGGCAASLLATPGWAQAAYPNKPIRYIVPFAAGGLTDVMARLVGRRLNEALGQPVVVDNKPGANANLGAEQAAKSPGDGYTWLAVTLTHAVNPALFPQLPYSISRDLLPVAHLANSPLVLVVNEKDPERNLKDFLAKARAKSLNGGSSGNGTPPHLGLELLALAADIKVLHVPYKGGAPSLNDLLGRQLDFIVANMPEAISYIKGGRLRALAVTSAKRHPLLPDVPTFAEAGLSGMELENWTALMMPKGTPTAIVEKVAGEATRAVKLPEISERLIGMGFSPTGLGPAEFGAILNKDMARWAEIVKRRGIKAD